jgi:hypothetical protein
MAAVEAAASSQSVPEGTDFQFNFVPELCGALLAVNLLPEAPEAAQGEVLDHMFTLPEEAQYEASILGVSGKARGP